jgi:acyl-CoA reductase-like NAD-dependent aldehyde dehydrogenase
MDDGRWSFKRGAERGAILQAVAAGIKANAAELADLESRDSGATVMKAKGADVGGAMAGSSRWASTPPPSTSPRRSPRPSTPARPTTT